MCLSSKNFFYFLVFIFTSVYVLAHPSSQSPRATLSTRHHQSHHPQHVRTRVFFNSVDHLRAQNLVILI